MISPASGDGSITELFVTFVSLVFKILLPGVHWCAEADEEKTEVNKDNEEVPRAL
jgi:hypothetical protein